MKLFLFECKKIVKKKSIWVAMIISVIAMAGFHFFNYSVAENIHQIRMLDLETSKINFPEIIAKDRAELEDAEKAGDGGKVRDLNQSIEIYETMLEDKQFEWKKIVAGKWSAISEKQFEMLDSNVKISKSQNFPTNIIMDQVVSMFTMRATAEEKRVLAETGVEPFVQRDTYTAFHPTIYDKFTGEVLELWEDTTRRYGKSGFYFLYQIIPTFIIPLLILIGCFVFGNTVSSEATKKRRGMNLYAVLPLERRGIFFAKLFSGMLFTSLFVLIILFVPIVSSLFTSGVGSLEYPVLIYDGPVKNPYGIELEATFLNDWTDTFHFITLGEYFSRILLLTVALVVFMFSIYFLLSLFIKSPSVNVAILLIATFFGMTVLPNTPYNPFTYIDIHKVVNREFAVSHFNEAINIMNGMMVLNLIGLAVIILCYLRFKRYVVE